MRRIEKNESLELGFVLTCLFKQAIKKEDLRKWADLVIESEKNYPAWVLDLCVFDGFPKDVYRLIGFVPDRELSEVEDMAICGIAYLRGHEPYEVHYPKDQALTALRDNHFVLEEFRKTFPFINI